MVQDYIQPLLVQLHIKLTIAQSCGNKENPKIPFEIKTSNCVDEQLALVSNCGLFTH